MRREREELGITCLILANILRKNGPQGAYPAHLLHDDTIGTNFPDVANVRRALDSLEQHKIVLMELVAIECETVQDFALAELARLNVVLMLF